MNVNLGLLKNIPTWKSTSTSALRQLLNTFNNRDWDNPAATMNSPNLGKNLNNPTPRTVTLSVKYSLEAPSHSTVIVLSEGVSHTTTPNVPRRGGRRF